MGFDIFFVRSRFRDEMVENGKISVTCEFCSTTYMFEPAEVADPKVN